MPLNVTHARQCLQDFDFRALFIQELGWDKPPAKLPVAVDGKTYSLQPIAEKRGFQVFECPALADGNVPDHATRGKIERQVAKSAHEHIIIYTDTGKTAQKWQWVRRELGRPLARREYDFFKGHTGELLAQKLQYLAVDLADEERLTLVDVTRRARQAFDVDRVTKRFYDRFKTEHETFLKFIKGITGLADAEWYASLMLNRLMFIYFIQKKGFLDNDHDYLRNRLRRLQAERGKDKFHTFYRYFLVRLFHEGLGQPTAARKKELEKLLGTVPYLNGGLFDVHDLERTYPDIQISDDAFVRLFDFFDAYQWHLDERPLRADTEINPDVLGYIFEKYINQKQMGAYYTKDDITGYIARNTVIPFLFKAAEKKCAIAFKPEGAVWRLLRDDPDRYIYPAVHKGVDLPLPPDVAAGLNDVSKRSSWNRPASPEHALATETWREHMARRQRCHELRAKLKAGELHEINDLITSNLDIAQFTEDVIANSEGPELLRAFYHAIQSVSVLDPTCGSGAFLFAALNLLEPLYETCLVRMQGFLEDLKRNGTKHHPEKFSDFRKVLDDVGRHPNHRYFILKSIIVGNLYGVDIMEEAVEICKLRLFLKLVAQVEKADQIEPLPDIDFNIRAGNSLIGFASLDEVKQTLEGHLGFGGQDVARIAEEADIVERAFSKFRQMQTEFGMDAKQFSDAKAVLRLRLGSLRVQLDRYLAGEFDIDVDNNTAMSKWRLKYQPFHWFAEFFGIMQNGGFDVILGNPPYVEIPEDYSRTFLNKVFQTPLERWSRDEDLYTLVVERCLAHLSHGASSFGMILPLSVAFSTKKPYQILRKVLSKQKGHWWWSHYDRIPSALFGNDVRTRCTIAILQRSTTKELVCATSQMLRWATERRDYLFPCIAYAILTVDISSGIPKVASTVQATALAHLLSMKAPLKEQLGDSVGFSELSQLAPRFPQPCVYVGGTAYNWFPVWRDIPETTKMDGSPSLPARTIGFRFRDEETANIVFAFLCSSLGYWWWAVASDAFNLKKWLLERFPLSVSCLSSQGKKRLAALGAELRKELRKHYVYKDNKGRIGNFFLPACKEQTALIDSALAVHVQGLSEAFFEDVRAFNESFSRAEVSDGTDDESDD